MDAASSSVPAPASHGGSIPLSVLKIGGSVLTGHAGYARVASHLAAHCAGRPAARLVVVVSAEFGQTDALFAEAVAIAAACGGTDAAPAAPDTALVDLLWSTGETRSVALLALGLRARGIAATGLSVHETGLEWHGGVDGVRLAPSRLRAALAAHSIVVVPGFLATCGSRIVSLGRGGSDWSAVALAIALGAGRCELVKDVDGYFTADPATSAGATPIARLSYRGALRMADDGCPLVQRPAIVAAAAAGLPLVVRSLAGTGTLVQEP